MGKVPSRSNQLMTRLDLPILKSVAPLTSCDQKNAVSEMLMAINPKFN